MKKSAIISVIALLGLLSSGIASSQTRSMTLEKYVIIEVQSGSHAGELYEGEVSFGVKVEITCFNQTDIIIMEMNKAQLINSTASTAGLTKTSSEKSTSKVNRFIKNTFSKANQYILTFEDGTTYDATSQILALF